MAAPNPHRTPLATRLHLALLRRRDSRGAFRVLRGLPPRGQARVPTRAAHPLLHRLAEGSASVLDVGTGLMRSLAGSPCAVRIGMDAHRPYLEHREDPGAVPLNATAGQLAELFVPGAVDLVTMIDVVEHLERPDAEEVLRQAEAVAARRVVLFTPRGHFPQEGHDAFGLGGEELQRHRSTWEPEDLTALGYTVLVVDGYHGPSNESFVEAFGPDADPVDALVAFKDRAV